MQVKAIKATYQGYLPHPFRQPIKTIEEYDSHAYSFFSLTTNLQPMRKFGTVATIKCATNAFTNVNSATPKNSYLIMTGQSILAR